MLILYKDECSNDRVIKVNGVCSLSETRVIGTDGVIKVK